MIKLGDIEMYVYKLLKEKGDMMFRDLVYIIPTINYSVLTRLKDKGVVIKKPSGFTTKQGTVKPIWSALTDIETTICDGTRGKYSSGNDLSLKRFGVSIKVKMKDYSDIKDIYIVLSATNKDNAQKACFELIFDKVRKSGYAGEMTSFRFVSCDKLK